METSASLSLQTSVIIQQIHNQRRQHQHQQPTKQDIRLTLWQRVRLTAALCGVEGSTSFEQIYTFLCLQYLGVPVAMMSIHGIMAGLIAVFCIFTLGMVTDRGPNPKRRKLYALLLAMGFLLSGTACIITACFLKIREAQSITDVPMEDFNKDLHGSTTFVSSVANESSINNPPQNYSKTTPDFIDKAINEPLVPVTGILGIAGFVLLDVGFDYGNPFIRAFILDHSPPAQHTDMLVMATLISSIAGLIISSLGCFDIAGAVEDTFGVDGTAGAFIILLCVIVVIIFTFFSCTLQAASSITKMMNEKKEETKGNIPTDNETSPLLRAPSYDNMSLLGLSIDRHAYMSLSTSVRSNLDRDFTNNKHTSLLHSIAPSEEFIHSQTLPVLEELPEYPSPSKSQFEQSESAVSETNTIEYDKLGDDQPHSDSQSVKAPERKPRYNPPAIFVSDNNHQKFKKTNTRNATNMSQNTPQVKTKPPLLNKRIVILIISTGLSTSGLLGVMLYSSNALTLGIFHGEPDAAIGTPENDHYRQGLRAAALGNVVLYVSYFFACLFNTRCFRALGEKPFYVICLGAITIAIVAVLLTEHIGAYYVMMALVGPYRTCVFTLPFVLANKYTQNPDGEGDNESRTGRVTAIIGSTLPCTYILVSTAMGPLISALGNVWVPQIWSSIAFVLSIGVFSGLFCMKD